ncbi:MAG: hypothetical protein ACLSGS_02515 [Adlercreutzia sp.]
MSGPRSRRARVRYGQERRCGLRPRARRRVGAEIISTGGTARALKDAGVPVTPIDDVTQFPEMMDGRVKTLHPRVHGGLLAKRDNEAHMAQAAEHGIEMIDMVVVNLYAFEKTVAGGADFGTCIENIDIGGPSMLRSAAKNFERGRGHAPGELRRYPGRDARQRRRHPARHARQAGARRVRDHGGLRRRHRRVDGRQLRTRAT